MNTSRVRIRCNGRRLDGLERNEHVCSAQSRDRTDHVCENALHADDYAAADTYWAYRSRWFTDRCTNRPRRLRVQQHRFPTEEALNPFDAEGEAMLHQAARLHFLGEQPRRPLFELADDLDK